MKIIDLRSDTVTLPSPEMRQAMFEAEVGDDVYGEDPTINRLEKMSARIMGKEAALFTTSGTQSNLIAILTHTHRDDEIILGDQSNTFQYEVGGAAALGGVMMHTVPNDRDGCLSPEDINKAIRPVDIHFPRTTLICLENTHNCCGGWLLPVEYMDKIYQLIQARGLKLHLDGARIFNAAVACGVPASCLAGKVDSVSFCLSKGLSAPVGSLLCGSQDFVERARKYRKMLGGGMRQAGILAAAGIVALETMVDRLSENHANAKRLARGLASIPGLYLTREDIPTNIIMFGLALQFSGDNLMRKLNETGRFFMPTSSDTIMVVKYWLNSLLVDCGK